MLALPGEDPPRHLARAAGPLKGLRPVRRANLDLAAQHQPHLARSPDVFQGIAGRRHEVGGFPWLQPPRLVADSQQPGGVSDEVDVGVHQAGRRAHGRCDRGDPASIDDDHAVLDSPFGDPVDNPGGSVSYGHLMLLTARGPGSPSR